MEVRSNSPQKTEKAGQELAKLISRGNLIALFGNLGTGKTVFVKGLAKGLGIKNKIVSPTFVFMRSYEFPLGGKPTTLHHIDLYRGDNAIDFETLGLYDLLTNDSIVVLEWADRIKDSLPKKRIDVYFENLDEKTRRIQIRNTR